MAIKLDLCECGSVTLDRLADSTLATVKLHGALDFESGRVGGVTGDTDENQPLVV